MIDPSRKLDSRLVVYAADELISLGSPSAPSQPAPPSAATQLNDHGRKWLEFRNSTTDLELLKEKLGVEVLFERLPSLRKRAEAAPAREVETLVEKWLADASEIEGDPREILTATAGWYVALKEDLEEKSASGFTTICSQLEHRCDCNPCFAFMILAAEGFGFSCGIDLNALVTELILKASGAGPMFQGNLIVRNLPEGRVSIHHCMAPFTMDSESKFNIRHVHSKPESRGFVSAVRFRKEPVTLARLDSRLDFIHVSSGGLVDYVNHRNRCINEAIVQIPSPEDFDEARVKPRPPSRIVHYVLTYGDHVDSLCNLAASLGVECRTGGVPTL